MVRVGVVGCGGMGGVHGAQYKKMPDVELAAFDRDEQKLAAYVKRFDARPIGSLDEMVAWSDVVDVCLPTDLHLDAALKAIASGRAVLLEKPMAPTLEACDQLIEAAQKASVPLMPAHVVRFFPEFRAAHDQVVGGAIGKPAVARTRRGGTAPKGADGWFMDRDRSGGVLLDLAIHDFDWLAWTLGRPTRVFARSVLWSELASPGLDYALATLSFESGAVAHVEATWMDPAGFRTTFEVCGDGGMIEYDSRQVGALRAHTAGGSRAESPMAPHDDPYYLEIRAFLDSVALSSNAPVSMLEGRNAVAICLAALESAKTRMVQSISSA